MPRNSRSSRSSASIVTLVSSSPFHQPGRLLTRRQGIDGAARAHVADRPRRARARRSSVPLHAEAARAPPSSRARRGASSTRSSAASASSEALARIDGHDRPGPARLEQLAELVDLVVADLHGGGREALGSATPCDVAMQPPGASSCGAGGRCRPACRSSPARPRSRAGRRPPGTRGRAGDRTPRARDRRVAARRRARRRWRAAHRSSAPVLPASISRHRRAGRGAALERHVGAWPGDHRAGSRRRAGAAAFDPFRRRGRSSSTWKASGGERVAGDDRLADAVTSPTPSAGAGARRRRRSRRRG